MKTHSTPAIPVCHHGIGAALVLLLLTITQIAAAQIQFYEEDFEREPFQILSEFLIEMDGEVDLEDNAWPFLYNAQIDSRGAYTFGSSDDLTEKWLITPPLHLEAGVTYDIYFDAFNPEVLDVFVGTSSTGLGGLDGESLLYSGASAGTGLVTVLEKFTPTTTDHYRLGFRAGSPQTGTLETVLDNIRVMVEGLHLISVGDAIADESDEEIGFPITIDPPPTSDIDLYYEIIHHTTSDDDFDDFITGMITYPADGITSQRVYAVWLWDDGIPELEETFTFRFSNPSQGYLYRGEARGVIRRNNFDTLLFEDFEDSTDTTMAGWTITQTGNPDYQWRFSTVPRLFIPMFSGRYAFMDSRDKIFAGSTAEDWTQRVAGYLESPSFSTVGYEVVHLNYNYYADQQNINYQEVRTEISVDGGDSWITVVQNPPVDPVLEVASKESINLSAVAAGYPDVRVRFSFDDFGYLNGHFAVDDVEVIAGTLPPEFRIVDTQTITPTINPGESVVFEVSLDAPNTSGEDIVVSYMLRGEINQNDFSDPLDGTIVISPGETTETITFASIDDDLVKTDRGMVLELSNLRGAGVFGVTDGKARATLLRNPTNLGPALTNARVYATAFKRTGFLQRSMSLITTSLDSTELVGTLAETFPRPGVITADSSDPNVLMGFDAESGDLFNYDLSSGVLSTLHPLSVPPTLFDTEINDIILTDTAPGGAYLLTTEVFTGLSYNRLLSLDITTGEASVIGRVIGTDRWNLIGDLRAIAVDSTGTIYAIDARRFLLSIDPETALATIVGDTLGVTLANEIYSITVDPQDDSLYMVARTNESPDIPALYYIDKQTGAAAFRGLLGKNIPGIDADDTGIYGLVITEDVTPPPSVLYVGSTSAIEGDETNTSMDFTIEINPPLASPETVDILLQDLTARAGIDYIDNSQTGVTVPAGVSSFTFPVEIIGNYRPEQDRVLSLTLSNPSGGLQLSPFSPADSTGTTAFGTIIDNDIVEITSFDFNNGTDGEPPVGWDQFLADDFQSPPLYGRGFRVAVPGEHTSLDNTGESGIDGTPFVFLNHSRDNSAGLSYRASSNAVLVTPRVDTTGFQLGVVLKYDQVWIGGSFTVFARDADGDGPWIQLEGVGAPQGFVQTPNIVLPDEVISEGTEIAFSYAVPANDGGRLVIDNISFLGQPLPSGFVTMEVPFLNTIEGDSGDLSDGPPLFLSDPAPNTIEVGYIFTGGTATRGVDYLADASGSFFIQPGETEATIPLQIVGNDLAELDKTIEFTLFVVSGDALFADNQTDFVVTIENDDIPAYGNLIAFDRESRTFHEIDYANGSHTAFRETEDQFTGMDFFDEDLDDLYMIRTTSHPYRLALLDLSTTDFDILIGPELSGIAEEEIVATMAYDWWFDTMVICTFTPAGVFSYYEVDLDTGDTFLLSTIDYFEGGILPASIGFDDQGNGYTMGATLPPDFVSGFYAVDVDEGTIDLIGPTGVGKNWYTTGMFLDWDPEDNLFRSIYYWNTPEDSRGPQHYGTFDLDTGEFTSLAVFDESIFFTGMAIRDAVLEGPDVEFDILEAVVQADQVTVHINWTTSFEVDVEGFRVYRADGEDLGDEITTSLIPAEGDEDTGASYTFTDPELLVPGELVRDYILVTVYLEEDDSLHGPFGFVLEEPISNIGDWWMIHD
ncbi:MAG: hypothetical protein JJU11_13425 [Candidatus Sumerlaeia bacterium]|nr:hypothetical protein [Candidatus Sumerlaeia bacterium]